MGDSSVFDDTLFSVLKECKTLPNFLDTVFGFLKRRTDFYCIADEPNAPIGLPPGWSEQFVKDAFFKWKEHNQGDVPTKLVELQVAKPEANTVSSEDKLESTSESYNGAQFATYRWSQNITDLDIIVNLPQDVLSKNLVVSILPQKITVVLKDSGLVLLEGDLFQKVKHNDAIWSLDKRKLEIHLDKSSEMWWNCLVQSEPKLDVSKIDCSRPFEELPEEAQAKIEELTWNQERKRLGLPTSEQMIMEEKLRKAWNVEGSPFKGPFDPSTVIIHP